MIIHLILAILLYCGAVYLSSKAQPLFQGGHGTAFTMFKMCTSVSSGSRSAQMINENHSSWELPAFPVNICLDAEFDVLVYTK